MAATTPKDHRSPVSPTRTRSADPISTERLLDDLRPVLDLSESDLVGLIPERSGLYFVGCPNCDGGAQEGQISWSIEHPHEVFCTYCGLRYPNEKYPDNQILRVENPRGQVQEYPYWEDDTGYRTFFSAKGWFLARAYFARAALDLARLYSATGDPAHARRSALILDRFAQVYPGYCVHYDFPFRQKIIFSGNDDFPYPVPDFRAAKWSWWAYMDIPEDLLRAYDLIAGSGILDEASQQCIQSDLFRASVAFVRSYPPALSNMDPTLLRGLIVAGRVLGEPEYIHDAVGRIDLLVQRQFLADGVWREGALSYHNQTVNGLEQLIDLLSGYGDPEGYVDPGDGEHFEDLDLAARFPILEKARQIPDLLRYPNGRTVAFHDTWAKERRAPTDTSRAMLLPALGHARLGRGSGPDQIQAHLHFSGGYGHQHADLLSMTLFARGQERLSDIGYTHTRYRCWTLSTLSHNTVTVDGQDQYPGSEAQPSDGNLLLFVPGDEVFQAVEASGERGYPGVTRVYRRLLLLIGVSPTEAYIVDVFQVQGGHRHEYVLVGDADHDGALDHELDSEPYGQMLLPAGVPVQLPTGESVRGDAGGHNLGYAFLRQVRQAHPAGPWAMTFRSEARPEGVVRVFGASAPGDTLYTATAPSVRRAGKDDGLLDQHVMPALLHRREGEDLTSTFATVLEAGGEHSSLRSVERLPLASGQGVAFRITGEEYVDHVLCASDGEASLQTGDLVLRGRLGFVRERHNHVERMTLVGGELLQKGSARLEGRGVICGSIHGVLRRAAGDPVDGFVVDADLTPGDQLAGLFAVVHDGAGYTHGAQVVRVEKSESQIILVIADDPGFEMDADGASRHCFFPGRSWTGENRFEIATVSTLVR